MHSTSIVRIKASEHGRPKVCDPEAPWARRSSFPALPPCASVVSVHVGRRGDESAHLTCR